MFMERLESLCMQRNTTIYSAVKAAGGNTGSIDGWKKKGSMPRADLLSALATHLNTSVDYLLERTNNSSAISEQMVALTSNESKLIDGLRVADPQISEAVYKMAFAVLDAPKPVEVLPQLRAFSSSKSEIVHHVTRKRIEGEAAAGLPITAVAGEDATSVPFKYSEDRFFVVRARGDSMEPIIPDGGLCVFNRDGSPDDGRIVLVQVDGQTDQPDDAIKRIYRHGPMVELRSVNKAHAPMFYPASEVQIAGVFVDVLPVDAV